ncbi:hypothetical protein SARC_11702, partial [Sphaeroforma arctica JP610]
MDFSRSVLREKFSAVVRKAVYTFEFDRFQKGSLYGVYRKLMKARETKGVIIATDTAVKAFQLKFVEVVHNLDRLQTAVRDSSDSRVRQFAEMFMDPLGDRKSAAKTLSVEGPKLHEQADLAVRTLEIFRQGTVIVDEVDLILHPLKSELNYPIGPKNAIDLARKGMRWDIPLYLLDALFYATEGRTTARLAQSNESEALLMKVKKTVTKGLESRDLQAKPHLTLLSRSFYMTELKPLMAEWLVLWLSLQQVGV